MRSFFPGPKRNGNWRLVDKNPVERFDDNPVYTGDAGLDGYTSLSYADPQRMGAPPPVPGTVGQPFFGPDDSFEQ